MPLMKYRVASSPPAARLLWDASPDSTVTGYNIYVGTNSGKYERVVNAGNHTNITVMKLNSGTTYYFVATAYDASGLESVPSNEVSWLAKPGTKIIETFKQSKTTY